MSLTEIVIGSQLQPTWLMLSDWPPETYIVLCVEMAHGFSDLIYSGTYVNIFFLLSSLSLSLLCSCLYLFTLCFPLLFVATRSLFISLFCWRSLILIADSLWCFDLLYGIDKGTGCVCVCGCVSFCIHMHTLTFMPCFPWPWCRRVVYHCLDCKSNGQQFGWFDWQGKDTSDNTRLTHCF